MGILLSEGTDAAVGGMGGLGMLLVWGVFIVVMFFMMTGPQKKEQKRNQTKHQDQTKDQDQKKNQDQKKKQDSAEPKKKVRKIEIE